MDVKLPELGENIETVEVSAVLVEVGARVGKDQPLIEVERHRPTCSWAQTAGAASRAIRKQAQVSTKSCPLGRALISNLQ